MFSPLPRSFFQHSAIDVAPSLLGKMLCLQKDSQQIGGLITEVEAYQGEGDLACHAHCGKTKRTAIMYGESGHAYVYFTYGMHWLFNIVTDEKEEPAAVLIRALFPTHGLNLIAQHRHPQPPELWCNGPAKLCSALGIDGSYNGLDLCDIHTPIQVSQGIHVPENEIKISPRIGINRVPEPWLSMPWRFYIPEIERFIPA